jgi:hypothetical protein
MCWYFASRARARGSAYAAQLPVNWMLVPRALATRHSVDTGLQRALICAPVLTYYWSTPSPGARNPSYRLRLNGMTSLFRGYD